MKVPAEFKVMRVRECAAPDAIADSPERVVRYWRENIPQAQWFDRDKESFVVIMLNTRCRIIGHALVTVGLVDSVQIHPREIFRPAIVAAAKSIVMVHNHPSGDPSPSEADMRISREMKRAGEILKIDVNDSIIIGAENHVSLRQMGVLF